MKIPTTLLTILVSTSTGFGFTTVADFNSVPSVPTTLNTAPANTTGTGFAGGSVWNSGSTTLVDVVSDDLSAPAGTNYNRPQSTGSGPRKVELELSTATPFTGTNSRAVGRDLEATVDSGIAWISFLINNPTGANGSLAAVSFNNSSTNISLGNTMLVGGGSDGNLYYSGNGMGGAVTSVSSVITADSDNLILARLDFDSNVIDIWANPDVDALGAADIAGAAIASTVTPGLTRLTVGGNNNAFIDNLLFSNDSDAYFQVTGSTIPEPSTMAFLLGGIVLGLATLRHRRR
ncbi:PEP-CTERM sorting domain-containing protein [Rubellicoccus peritrichatus]|uniref:PEP-CTERM sorting domain-containing protein n=1 Tax=Rubellicoccus peritrichatus TaxID=3080537 RepID=A0AAQ3LH02_9BACT|nr:PEP-CTERM sorting domain-containing protein [Puniceicoccus sp. CR14]WOO43705.1 PEP-CTERM sorting domain-containing protein [Puniceicoccus sp. CR14]